MKPLHDILNAIKFTDDGTYNGIADAADTNDTFDEMRVIDEAYYNGKPLIPDHVYDKMWKKLYDRYPDNEYFSKVGAEVSGEKVDLPYPMGSLNQVYENETSKWITKYDLLSHAVIITEKLDGVSVLLIYESGKLKRAYSRGDGIKGEDVTRHIRHLPAVPKTIDTEYAAVRAEIIMKNDTFATYYAKKYKNPRNMVAGVINRKTPKPEILGHIDVVAYEIIDSTGADAFTKIDTLHTLKRWGLSTARNILQKGRDLTDEDADAKLSKLLVDFKETGAYELDGIVITVNDYSVFEDVSKSSSLNPEHSVKFKVMDESSIVETKVKNVLWKISKTGFCKPRVEIEPVELFGTTVTYATGFNAKYIYNSGIGPGAKIRITKAGSVIPYIVDVVETVEPSMPDEDWEWDENGVEAVVSDTWEQTLMEVVHFFKTIEMENAQETSLSKIIKDQGLVGKDFSTIVYELVSLLDIEWKRTLGENGTKVYDSLHKKLSTMKPETLMGATPFFGRGFGVRKAKKLLEQISYEDFRRGNRELFEDLEGFNKTVSDIVSGIQPYNDFTDQIDFALTYQERDEGVEDTLAGQVIVMTGFRDKELQQQIEDRGGKVTSSVSKKTTILIAQDVNSTSSKVKKAKDLGIEVISQRDFNFQYIQ